MKIYLQILKLVASSFGYRVILSDCDSWDYTSKIICINKKRTPKAQIACLLHELGHALLFENSTNEGNYYIRFPGLKPFARSDVNKISEIEQEILAWEYGRIIACSLSIPTDRCFHQTKIKCLKTYFENNDYGNNN